MCSWVLINHKWPRLKKTVLIGNYMWPFISFLRLFGLVYQNKKKSSNLWSFHCQGWVLGTYCVYLVSVLTSVFAVAHYYGWVLLWFISDAVLKAQLKKKKTHFNCFFPALEEKHFPVFPTVGKSRPGWAVDGVMCSGCDLAIWVWIYCWLHPCCYKECSVLSLSQKPLSIQVSILLPVLALLLFSGSGCVPD